MLTCAIFAVCTQFATIYTCSFFCHRSLHYVLLETVRQAIVSDSSFCIEALLCAPLLWPPCVPSTAQTKTLSRLISKNCTCGPSRLSRVYYRCFQVRLAPALSLVSILSFPYSVHLQASKKFSSAQVLSIIHRDSADAAFAQDAFPRAISQPMHNKVPYRTCFSCRRPKFQQASKTCWHAHATL